MNLNNPLIPTYKSYVQELESRLLNTEETHTTGKLI